MKRKQYFIMLLSVGSALLMLLQWRECQRLTDYYYFSALDLQLRLIESIHNDSGIPLFLVRLFHNKLLGSLMDVFRAYVLYWDVRFLLTLIGPLGVVLSGLGIFRLVKEKKPNVLLAVLAVLFILPFISLFRLPVPFSLWVVLYAALFIVMAVHGVRNMKLPLWHMLFFIMLFFLTIWWQSVYSPKLLEFCL